MDGRQLSDHGRGPIYYPVKHFIWSARILEYLLRIENEILTLNWKGWIERVHDALYRLSDHVHVSE